MDVKPERQPKPKRVVEYEGTLIGTVPRKDSKEDIRVYLREYKGRDYVEVRRWLHLDKYDGPYLKKGVTFYLDEAAPIAELIQEAVREYAREKEGIPMHAESMSEVAHHALTGE